MQPLQVIPENFANILPFGSPYSCRIHHHCLSVSPAHVQPHTWICCHVEEVAKSCQMSNDCEAKWCGVGLETKVMNCSIIVDEHKNALLPLGRWH